MSAIGQSGPASEDALHVVFVLDTSGSMEPLTGAVIEGFDDFLRDLRDDGGRTLFTLTTFDTRVTHAYVAEPIANVRALGVTGYVTGGGTALYDAVGHAVVETDRRLRDAGAAAEKVMVVVMTDGEENSSTDYDRASISRLVRDYGERPNWTFVYLGAHSHIDGARDAAERIAFSRTNAMRWDADRGTARRTIANLGSASRTRRRAANMKTDALFEEAGQTEADYTRRPRTT